MTQEEIKYINSGYRQFTFIISQPLCGANELLTLASIAGGCGIRGVKPVSFYKSIIELNNMDCSESVYGSPKKLFDDGISLLHYNHSKPEFQNNLRNHYLRNLLMPLEGHGKVSAETLLGFNNNLLIPFVETLRNIFQGLNTLDLKIIFLTDNFDSLIDRMHRFSDPLSKIDFEILRNLINRQKDQMKEASELGDTWMTIDDIHSIPHDCLMKLKPTIFPKREVIEGLIKRFNK